MSDRPPSTVVLPLNHCQNWRPRSLVRVLGVMGRDFPYDWTRETPPPTLSAC